MRLIASFEDEQAAYTVHSVLMEAGIESSVTAFKDKVTGIHQHQLWIVNEEDMDKAVNLYEQWCLDPVRITRVLPSEEKEPLIKGPIKVSASSPLVVIRRSGMLTRWIIIICVLLFLWNGYQKGILSKTAPALMEYFGLTSLVMHLMYDVPEVFTEIYAFFIAHPDLKIEEMQSWPPALQQELMGLEHRPYWQGYYERVVGDSEVHQSLSSPPFTKIREGELWRLLTPALLHGNFLHILFNMLWLWMLGKEVESRIGKVRYLLLMILTCAICNTAQYLVSGPLFMGYSGVICGLGGFIWVRQKKAPWEGYTIPVGTLLFLFIFIVGMLVLQTVALVVSKMEWGEFAVGRIGNTAHIIGLLSGLICARIPYFYRVKS